MIIRELNINELPAAFEMICKLAKETNFDAPNIRLFIDLWAEKIFAKSGVIFGAFENRLIGIISALMLPDMTTGKIVSAEMHWYVDAEHRRAGVGSGLFGAFLNWSKQCDKTAVAHPVEKPWMGELFKRFGFKALETFYTKEE